MKLNKKHGSATTQVFFLLIAVVFASALILYLIQSGILSVKAQGDQVPLLNTQFIPIERQGSLAIKDFQFCRYVDEQFNCPEPQEIFNPGDEVHFKFVAESSTYNGEIMIVENYQLKAPNGEIILNVDQKNTFDFNSNKPKELINLKDYFTILSGSPAGQYTVTLNLENPLLDKKTVLVKMFTVTG